MTTMTNITNSVRILLFGRSMSLVNLLVLFAVSTNFKFWIALPMYIFWCWLGEPILAKIVGATPEEMYAQQKNDGK